MERRSTELITQARFTVAQKQLLRRRLLAWYAKHARDLPWRRSRDPYRVWISEVMLQQTQVATVRDYFTRFITAFPDVRSLADADETDVLRLWEGLGYYRRARQLHVAARKVVSLHSGRFPSDLAVLQTLPGIGRYTAGAIASIAFDQRAPILEANTIRLFTRLIAFTGEAASAARQSLLWKFAEEILPQNGAARFNQALMELGSLVCTPSDPKCDSCPLASLCAANKLGMQQRIPAAKPRPTFTHLREAAIIVRKNGSVLMRRCGETERWAGLWDFPRFELDSTGPLFAQPEIVAKVAAQTGIRCAPGAILKTLKHGVTRYRITLDCYEAAYVSGRLKSSPAAPIRWTALPQLSVLPLSTTGRKIAKLIAR
jgi:A/G-specific adenine glycosylase